MNAVDKTGILKTGIFSFDLFNHLFTKRAHFRRTGDHDVFTTFVSGRNGIERRREKNGLFQLIETIKFETNSVQNERNKKFEQPLKVQLTTTTTTTENRFADGERAHGK